MTEQPVGAVLFKKLDDRVTAFMLRCVRQDMGVILKILETDILQKTMGCCNMQWFGGHLYSGSRRFDRFWIADQACVIDIIPGILP